MKCIDLKPAQKEFDKPLIHSLLYSNLKINNKLYSELKYMQCITS